MNLDQGAYASFRKNYFPQASRTSQGMGGISPYLSGSSFFPGKAILSTYEPPNYTGRVEQWKKLGSVIRVIKELETAPTRTFRKLKLISLSGSGI